MTKEKRPKKIEVTFGRLMRAALLEIKQNPSSWEQRAWCGTARCIGGHMGCIAFEEFKRFGDIDKLTRLEFLTAGDILERLFKERFGVFPKYEIFNSCLYGEFRVRFAHARSHAEQVEILSDAVKDWLKRHPEQARAKALVLNNPIFDEVKR